MVKNPKIIIVFSSILAFLISCSKIENPKNLITNNPLDKNSNQTEHAIEVGTGLGDLIIDGNDKKLKEENLIIIKAGFYNTVSIKNLHGKLDAPISIKNAGLVTIKDVMNIENVSDVTMAGDHVNEMEYGINLHDISYRAIILTGELSGLTISNVSFKNVKDFVIYIESSKERGTAEMRKERIKILNCKFENAGDIQFVSDLKSDGDKGFMNGFEFANNIIANASPGNFAYIANVKDYDIHHNTVNNLNKDNNNHNGVFHMIGNGKFHDNKFINYQGNMIRAWAFSRGSSPSTIEIFNNIAYNTRKYGAFEIQGFDRYIIPGKTTIANAKVYNNTVGKMNTSKDWEGGILDLYNYGGTLEYYNNLGFDLIQSGPITDMINNMSNTRIIKNTNNKYFKSASEAVFDLQSFASKHVGVGSNL